MPEKSVPAPFGVLPGHFFRRPEKIQKIAQILLIFLGGPWALFTRFGALAAIHPRLGNRYIYDVSKGHCDVFDPCMQNERCMHAWERGRVDFLFGI